MVNILVIDDDKNTRLLLRAVLESEGYDVFTAADGAEGWRSWIKRTSIW